MREYSTLPSESDRATATKAFEVTASSTDASHAVVQPSGEMDRSNVHLLTLVRP